MPLHYKAWGKDPFKSGLSFPKKMFGTTLQLLWATVESFQEVAPFLFRLASTQYTQELSTSWADSGLPVQRNVPGKFM